MFYYYRYCYYSLSLLLLYSLVELQSLQEKYSQRSEEMKKSKNEQILGKEKIKELEIHPNDGEMKLMTGM